MIRDEAVRATDDQFRERPGRVPGDNESAELAGAAAELVERTCREQGLPERVVDPTALANVAAVLREPGELQLRRAG